ncbi:flagellar assembly protein FliH [Pseudoxanthomonas sp. GM95]|uniref:FliH/SctL family protein n=1 Tax=Pseudoxanthomonas sp. GM95 TaxID=1881043 RepID=UPI0008CD7D6B|nr:FliH/SctL family protein [Pseudoxanthomonas sp. GM95]SEK50589.1 flagellar assembly protein FliH [Pseudoxanthomonas sp. GM95]
MHGFSAAADAVRWNAPGLGPRAADPVVPKPPTAAEIDQITSAAQSEGHAAGYAAGYAAGQAEVQRRIAQIQSVLDGFTRPLARLDGEVADALSDLSVRIAGVLVGHAYAADPSLLADLVREALDAVGSGSREIELRLHGDDFSVLAPHLAGLDGVRLTADASLGRGELRLNSEGVRIDGTLHARLQSVLDATLAASHDAEAIE